MDYQARYYKDAAPMMNGINYLLSHITLNKEQGEAAAKGIELLARGRYKRHFLTNAAAHAVNEEMERGI